MLCKYKFTINDTKVVHAKLLKFTGFHSTSGYTVNKNSTQLHRKVRLQREKFNAI